MKRITIVTIVITLLTMIMTQTIMAVPESDNAIIGAIRACPRCNNPSLHTCGGPNNTYDADVDCSLHDPCVKMFREQYKTFAKCNYCNYGDGLGGGDGYAGTHIETEFHTYTRQTYNICIFNAQ